MSTGAWIAIIVGGALVLELVFDFVGIGSFILSTTRKSK